MKTFFIIFQNWYEIIRHSFPERNFVKKLFLKKKGIMMIDIDIPPSISRDKRAASSAFPHELRLIIDTISGASLCDLKKQCRN